MAGNREKAWDYQKKDVTEATFRDIKQVAYDADTCDGRSCDDCLSDRRYWTKTGCGLSSCSDVRNALFFELAKKIESKQIDIDTEQIEVQTSPNALSHAQTINFMKRSGYTHCYMCGANLHKKEEI